MIKVSARPESQAGQVPFVPRGVEGPTTSERPTKAARFWLWFATGALIIGVVAIGLRGRLSNEDRQAIEQMLDEALPY